MQVYIVAGGRGVATSETLLKDGGTSWQSAASLPSVRDAPRGIGLDNGHFLVTGEGFCIIEYFQNRVLDICVIVCYELKVEDILLMFWSMILKPTSG